MKLINPILISNKRHIGLTLVLLFSCAAPISAATFTVINNNPAGAGSLFAAITSANGAPGSTINFNIPGTGPFVITPAVDLPDITAPVTINGYSQPGSSQASGSTAATILIEIQGANTTVAGLHLAVGSIGSIIQGLAINSCTFTPGIKVDDANNVIAGNYIGMNAAGTQALPNMSGIIITTNGNTIGGGSPAERNVISCVNQSLNARVRGSGADIAIAGGNNNIITGNYLGTDPSGTFALGISEVGAYIHTGTGNNITSNLISGNTFGGIILGATSIPGRDSTLIQNNLIGTDLTGTSKIPNGFGIAILSNATNTTISNNTISGNDLTGIQIGTMLANIYFTPPSPTVQGPTTILNNFVGIDKSGIKALGNGRYGIEIHQATTNTTIGTVGNGNVISANGLHGISISSQATNTTVIGNFVGTDKSGTLALANGLDGISIGGAQKPASNNTIGNKAAAIRLQVIVAMA